MRLTLFFLSILAGLMLAACQNQDSATGPATSSAAQDLQGGGEASSRETAEPRKGELVEVSREDAQALLNGRMLLTVFLNQTEGIPAPLADKWRLERVEQLDEDRRLFTFSSGEWALTLREPAADEAVVLYHARLSGPELAEYLAEIRADGSVFPAQ